MATQLPITFRMTAPAIGAFPALFVPRAFKDKNGVERKDKDKNYSIRLLYRPEHPDLPGMRQRIIEAAQQEWPNADFGDPSAPNFMAVDWPLKAGDALANAAKAANKDQEHLRGFIVMNSSTGEKYPPGLGVIVNGEVKDVPSGEERAAFSKFFYGGVEVLCEFTFKAFKVGNNAPVVKPYLQVVQSLAPKGERNAKLEAGGGKSSAAAFGQAVRGHVSSVDPTGGTSLPTGMA